MRRRHVLDATGIIACVSLSEQHGAGIRSQITAQSRPACSWGTYLIIKPVQLLLLAMLLEELILASSCFGICALNVDRCDAYGRVTAKPQSRQYLRQLSTQRSRLISKVAASVSYSYRVCFLCVAAEWSCRTPSHSD